MLDRLPFFEAPPVAGGCAIEVSFRPGVGGCVQPGPGPPDKPQAGQWLATVPGLRSLPQMVRIQPPAPSGLPGGVAQKQHAAAEPAPRRVSILRRNHPRALFLYNTAMLRKNNTLRPGSCGSPRPGIEGGELGRGLLVCSLRRQSPEVDQAGVVAEDARAFGSEPRTLAGITMLRRGDVLRHRSSWGTAACAVKLGCDVRRVQRLVRSGGDARGFCQSDGAGKGFLRDALLHPGLHMIEGLSLLTRGDDGSCAFKRFEHPLCARGRVACAFRARKSI